MGVYGDYVGRYAYAILTVTREGDRVFAQATGEPKFEIFPQSETEFFWKVVEAQVTFVKDDEGNVTHARHRQGGWDIVAPKIIDTEVGSDIVGRYAYAILTVTREGDRLFAQLTRQPKFEIFPTSETEFFWKVVEAQVTFVKDNEGRVTHARHRQRGEFEAPKISQTKSGQPRLTILKKGQGPDQETASNLHCYDVGSSSPWSHEPGGQIAVFVTPDNYPAIIKSAQYFVTGGGIPGTPFRIRLYRDDGLSGLPGTDLLKGRVFYAVAEAGCEWVSVDLSPFNVQIDDGSFYVAMEWLIAPKERGHNAQFLGYYRKKNHNVGWWLSPGRSRSWVRVGEVFREGDRNPMINVDVENPTARRE